MNAINRLPRKGFAQNRLQLWLLGAASAALLAVPAGAQAADPQDGAQADAGGFEDIVVTAQFREESVQKTALSIDVLSAESLSRAGVVQATDIARMSPGVQITQGGSALQVYIRGAGDFATTGYSNAAVAQAYDGIFAARSQFVAGTFFDLERVEVLKGPQGTLYGRNSTGGAINIIPVQPKLGEFGGFVTAGVQNYNGFLGEGAINIPLGDTAAIRISAQGVTRDGYLSDGNDDDKHFSMRVQFRAEPTDSLTFRVGANYQHLGGRGPGKVVYAPTAPTAPGLTNPQPIIPEDRWTSINESLNALISKVTAPPGIYHLDTETTYQDVTVWGGMFRLDWDMGPATLTVIPALQHVTQDSLVMPALYFSTNNFFTGAPSTSDAQTLEVRLANQSDVLKWVVGAYYFNEDQDSYNAVRLGRASDTAFIADLNTRAYAVFGEATYSLAETFRVTGGLRYTDETKSVDAYRYAIKGSLACANGGTGPGGSCPIYTSAGTNVRGEYSFDKVNFRVGVEFDAAPESMIYANVATGFKSGGQSNADVDPYKPEEVTAYTLGAKNRFFDDLMQFNLELFYLDYRDRQENFSMLDRGGAQVSTLFNAGKAVAKGATLDLMLRPSRNDTLRVAVEYVDSEYKDFVYNNYRVANPSATTTCGVTAVPNGNAHIGYWQINCTGFELPRTPKWSGNVSYSHIFDFDNGGRLELSPDMSFASSRWLSAEFVQNARAPSYVAFNASATYHSPDDNWTLMVFMRNIGNEAIYNGTQQYPFIANYNGQDIAPPRTFGARFSYRF